MKRAMNGSESVQNKISKNLLKIDQGARDNKSFEIMMKNVMNSHDFAMQEEKEFKGHLINFLKNQIVYSFHQPVMLQRTLYGVKVMNVHDTDKNVLRHIFEKLNPDIEFNVNSDLFMKMIVHDDETLDSNAWSIKIAIRGFKIGKDGCPKPMLYVVDAKEVSL